MLVGNPHRLTMTAGQRLGFAMFATPVDWTHGVNDVSCGESPGCGDDCLSGGQGFNFAHDLAAFSEDGRTTGAVNRTRSDP